MLILWIAIGGALGALARYGLSGWVYGVAGARLPWGTLAVNLAGCFLIGVLAELTLRSGWVGPQVRAGVGIGFLGSFTTFSTFAVETWREMERGDWLAAGGNLLLNTVGGLALVMLGLLTARALLSLRGAP